MKEMTVGLVQANFRSAFDEPLVELAAFSQPGKSRLRVYLGNVS